MLQLNSSRQLFETCQPAHSMLNRKVCLKSRVARFAGQSRLFGNEAAQLQVRVAKKSRPRPWSVGQEGLFIDFAHMSDNLRCSVSVFVTCPGLKV